MLQLFFPEEEYWDEEINKFVKLPEVELPPMEHSLVSISKWETKYEKPFLSNDKDDKTSDEIRYYIQCMALEPFDESVLSRLGPTQFEQINEYISKKSTATWFSEEKKPGAARFNRKIITSEVIYGWMVGLQIPAEFENWNINRLMTLIKICQINQEPPKKMGKRQAAEQQRKLNAMRREQYNTTG